MKTTLLILLALLLSSVQATTIYSSFDLEIYQKSMPYFIKYFVDSNITGQLMSWEDFDEDWIRVISEGYLNNPKAVDNLPKEIKEKLYKDIVFLESNIKVELFDLSHISDPLKFSEHSKQSITSNDAFKRDIMKMKNDTMLDTLNTRWNNLPVEKLKSAIKFEYLPDHKQALIIARYKKDTELGQNILYLKYITMSDEKMLSDFLEDNGILPNIIENQVIASLLSFEWDSVNEKAKAVDDKYFIKANPEIKLQTKLKGVQNTIKVITNIANKINAFGSILSPKNDQSGNASIHYHFSIEDYPFPAETADQIMELYKLRNFFEHLSIGNKQIMVGVKSGNGMVNNFWEKFNKKGNVRKINDYYFEIRESLEGPEKTLNELNQLFNIHPDEAITKLITDVNRLHTPEINQFIIEYINSSEYEKHFEIIENQLLVKHYESLSGWDNILYRELVEAFYNKSFFFNYNFLALFITSSYNQEKNAQKYLTKLFDSHNFITYSSLHTARAEFIGALILHPYYIDNQELIKKVISYTNQSNQRTFFTALSRGIALYKEKYSISNTHPSFLNISDKIIQASSSLHYTFKELFPDKYEKKNCQLKL